MIPYFEQPRLDVGLLHFSAFGVLWIGAILVARFIIMHRATRRGFDANLVSQFLVCLLISGLAGAHVVKTVMSDLPGFLAEPARIFTRYRGMTSFGGLAGGLVGGILWARLRGLDPGKAFLLLDVVAYSLPFGWLVGRLGCALAHDHRGLGSNSWIAVRFPEGSRYDLGLIEFLYLILLSAVFYLVDRRPRRVGLYFGLFGVLYGVFRVWLDTLHVQPFRFIEGAVAMLAGVAGLVMMSALTARARTRSLPAPGQP
jgi:phosphatidylglycerol---prolipoprotein diacylglyceryl transferase